MQDTKLLWDDLVNGKYSIFISQVVVDEIERCPEPKRSQMLKELRRTVFEVLDETDEVKSLANEYIKGGVLREKSIDDCLHIAFAVVHNCDIIVSWNFKHLVNFKTISKVKVVNAINQYREISIMPPKMLLEEVE
jgi:predicted nucleic acid-binding protein